MPREELDKWRRLADELGNFQEIARCLQPSPGEIPRLKGVEIAGQEIPLLDVIGGDHIIYVDFKQRYDLAARIADAEARGQWDIAHQLQLNFQRAGILVADVAGHRITDALVAAMLHQAFFLGSYYELDLFGQITTKLFEQLKTRFYESTKVNKFITMIYGEIAEDGRFRFISAGHNPPLIYSRVFKKLVPLGLEPFHSDAPIGIFPSGSVPDRNLYSPAEAGGEVYRVNEIRLLGTEDILILHTDGFSDHGDGRFLSERLEPLLNEIGHLSAAAVSDRLRSEILQFGPREDDISYVVIKKTN